MELCPLHRLESEIPPKFVGVCVCVCDLRHLSGDLLVVHMKTIVQQNCSLILYGLGLT